jgi:hypothetical protein
MVDPVSSGVRGKGKVAYDISVNFTIELEEDTEACVCKDGMQIRGEYDSMRGILQPWQVAPMSRARRNLSTWQTIHQNLQDHVSVHRHA